jgi:hypothetical protein
VRINVSARAAYLAGVVLLLGEFAVAHIAHTLMRMYRGLRNGFVFMVVAAHLLTTACGSPAWTREELR